MHGEGTPKFTNDAGMREIRIGVREFECIGATPPYDHPHVYLDTVVLVGSLSARHGGTAAVAFGAGAGLASIAWFYGLGYGARFATPLFARPQAWQVLDVLIGIVMWAIAAQLVVAIGAGG